jgi:hypothetical protein
MHVPSASTSGCTAEYADNTQIRKQVNMVLVL